VDSSDDAIMALDMDERVVAWNGGAEHTFGHAAAAVLGQPAAFVAGDRESDDSTWEMVAAARAGRSSRGQVEWSTEDGRQLHLALTVSPIRDAAEEIVGTAVIARDITAEVHAASEREELQLHLNEIQRLESVGELAGGIAHDFNNLLSVILSYASFAVEELAGHPARAEVEEIRQAAERAAALTHQLLTFSRREVVHPEVFQPNGLLAELEQLLDRTIGEHIELRVARDGTAPRIRCDRSQLEQIVMNLAINARDAMPEGGVLTIETAREVRAEGPYLCLSVSDTGEGMEPAVRAQIFEPFFTTKPAGRGTGLGLATVYGIVRRAGALIEVDSTAGKGSVFRVLFPAVESAGEERASLPGVSFSERNGHETILIVEDERQVAAVASRILSARGYSPVVVGSAVEALGLIDGGETAVDMVLTDLVMPEMAGSQLAEEIHARRVDLPMVFMSGYTNRPDSLPGGAFFLAKPFTSAALLAVVEDALVGSGSPSGG
jgi:PAS domain S-box-containing protein